MKAIILYATKYGATAEIAKRIAASMVSATTLDIKFAGDLQLNDFDCVIIGSSIYAGAFRKEAKAFLSQNTEELCKKKLGLFICSMGDSNEDEVFKKNVPAEVLLAAKVKAALGGAFDPKKANFLECLIMKAVTKQSGYLSSISDEKISKFAQVMKA
jgi:menaquinone-dependent protoporphyrinogen oxidase